jgi:hypothetical protein
MGAEIVDNAPRFLDRLFGLLFPSTMDGSLCGHVAVMRHLSTVHL